ncbi:zinc finger domain-containing protein [Streptomyces bauhiniae]|uniref:zinc finger domain-containing protein n=1 Tax=Streptomyces bauhiniae TaxID=2340725 RepID=UPI0035E3282B
MTHPIRRQGPYRFSAMAVRCTWCKAGVGVLCSNQRGTVARRAYVHDDRIADWNRVMSTQCPERICQAAVGHLCTITPDIHQARVLAAPAPTTTTP